MNKRKRLLLADNLPEYRRSLHGFLELEGYDFAEAGTPEEAQDMLETEEFDLVLVDLRMRDDDDVNDMSGLEIAQFASSCEIPCIFVTAFPSVDVARAVLRSRGAEPYAQDIVPKSSGAQALIDSINLILRSRDGGVDPPSDEGLRINPEKGLVSKDGRVIKLPKNQYKLLEALYEKDGGVCTYSELILAIYGEKMNDRDAQNDGRLRNLVDRTKLKIEDRDSDHEYLEAVTGRGYRLNLKK